ncbi:MAG: hypothetical protein ACRDQI_11545 [Pseudonocardiaceae bacterium]
MSPTIARNEMALWKLYLVDAHYGSLGYDGFHRWEILEGRYTLAVLFEYAGTLGLLDLDYVHPTGARDDFQDNWGGDDLDALSRYRLTLTHSLRWGPIGATGPTLLMPALGTDHRPKATARPSTIAKRNAQKT